MCRCQDRSNLVYLTHNKCHNMLELNTSHCVTLASDISYIVKLMPKPVEFGIFDTSQMSQQCHIMLKLCVSCQKQAADWISWHRCNICKIKEMKMGLVTLRQLSIVYHLYTNQDPLAKWVLCILVGWDCHLKHILLHNICSWLLAVRGSLAMGH